MSGNSNKWTCEYCTYMNWLSSVHCTLCHALRPVQWITPTSQASLVSQQETISLPRSLSQWPCRACTFLNRAHLTKCTTCYTPRGSLAPAVDKNNRAITRTTSMNRVPEICQPSNNERNRAGNLAIKKWSCHACTYENWPKAKMCILCHHPRPRLPVESKVSSLSVSRGSPPESPPRSPDGNIEFQQVGAAAAAPPPMSNIEHEKRVKQIRRRLRKSDWLFLNACVGVVDGDTQPVEAYLSSGGDPTRQLTHDETLFLNRPSAFDAGLTLVHLAIRFQREDLLAVLLTTDVSSHVVKRPPSQVCPDLAACIRKEISSNLRQRKGDFPCYFATDIVTFTLPGEIEELPLSTRNQLMDELLDGDVQKELEQESTIINWSLEITGRLGSRLYALWNRTAGDCLLDSALQATWGVFDADCVLRRALGESLRDCSMKFYARWKEYESMQVESMHFSLDEDQWLQDWALMLSRAGQPGAALEQTHIFVLAHILRRPIIVYGVKFIKSFRGENLGFARFQGVYLPLLWEPSFCSKNPIALAYTRGHFSALVAMETETDDNIGAGANLDTEDDAWTVCLPLSDSDGKILPVHFISSLQVGTEEKLLRDWLDCRMTCGGSLVAQQTQPRRLPVIVGQMIEEWLQKYRHANPHCT
ncbi:ubiquitin thioesterase zranb1-B-like [Antedon mediterranea]|uniref:ubiquitin thioesterase zranb1-B-like n=1 Tax=Antedon mediterranea TaxID=105859 RepID=UPI003AF70034